MKNKEVCILFLAVSLILQGAVCSNVSADEVSGSGQKTNKKDSVSSRFTLPFPEAGSDLKKKEVSGVEKAAEPEGKKKKTAADYKIQLGDRLNVKIYPEDEYVKGGIMQVSSEGTVTLPLVGKVSVLGKTPVEAEKEMVKVIDADYLVNPEVVVEIMEYASKSVNKRIVIALGQIRKPGTYEIPPEKEKITLLELISMAGGFTEIANVKKIKIIHKRDGKKEVTSANGEAIISGSSPDVELEPGDVVNVAESMF